MKRRLEGWFLGYRFEVKGTWPGGDAIVRTVRVRGWTMESAWERLRRRLPETKTVTVTVTAGPLDWPTK